MPELSPVLDRFAPSTIAVITDTAAALKKDGRRLYDFSTGEPDFTTPAHICEAAVAAMQRGETGYTPIVGSYAMREAIQYKYRRDNGLEFETGQLIVGNGAKPLIADILRALCAPETEVVLATPCWTSHPGMIRLVGCDPVLVHTRFEDGFRMRPQDLDAAMSDRTRAVILNAPSNPAGTVYDADQLAALAEVIRRYPDAWIVTDDLYEHIVFDGRRCPCILEVAPDLKERTVLVNGMSKGYAMTGWRIGYAAAPAPVVKGVSKIMSQGTGCPSSISQAAAAAALTGPMDCVLEFTASYEDRRNMSVAAINDIPGIQCHPPDGAFYLYPRCADLLGRTTPGGQEIGSSTDFVRYLLEDWSVVCVPGAAFEYDPHFRVSIATDKADLARGIELMAEAVAALS